VEVIERLQQATNAHDLDALVACFSEGYTNETPTHPARGFVGREQVRTNWSRIFAAVPDLSVSVPCRAADGDAVWTEWEMRGIRADGATHLMRGVIIFGVDDELISWARFYLEPVDESGTDINTAVGRTLDATAS
jgi:limonene-1,2-epoxide hydrolase